MVEPYQRQLEECGIATRWFEGQRLLDTGPCRFLAALAAYLERGRYAAFAANVHNKSLYQTEMGMLERLRFDSGLAWDGPFPRPTVTASLTF